MAGEKKIEQSEAVDAGLESDICTPTIEKETDSSGIIASDETVSQAYARDATSTAQGYNGGYNQLNANNDITAGGGSYMDPVSDVPDYNAYASGTVRGVDGKQPYMSSTGYLQNSGSYRNTAIHGRGRNAFGSNYSVNQKGFNNHMKTNNTLGGRSLHSPLYTKARQFIGSPNFPRSPVHTPSLRPLDKLGSGYQSAGAVKGFQPVGKFASYTNRNQGGYFSQDTAMSHRPNARMWKGDNRFDSRENSERHRQFEAMAELSRGPRDQRKSNPVNSSTEDKPMGFSMRRYKYNQEDFRTEYGDAKFFVIKSYSEDDIHKSIKYGVWSSTPNGNEKLDAAFHNTSGQTSEVDTRVPIFLFYSVNGSGQFLGLAEMVGPVDFDKNMDFWQRDKWNGFFPVKWNIIKDIPNSQLWHIILENNENKSVTHSRDTQEIGLQEGLQMLKIFKNFARKTSILDDFTFYENREQSLREKRRSMPVAQSEMYGPYTVQMHQNSGERRMNGGSYTANNVPDPSAPLVRLTKNLSLNSTPMKAGPIMNRRV